MNGSPPTFMLQFTWGLYAEHGTVYRRTENLDTVSSAKAPPGETEEQRAYEGRGQVDFNFKDVEIHYSGRCENPSAEGAGTFLDRDR